MVINRDNDGNNIKPIARFTDNVRACFLLASEFTNTDKRKRISIVDLFYALLFYPSSVQELLAKRFSKNMEPVVKLKPRLYSKINRLIEERGGIYGVLQLLKNTNKDVKALESLSFSKEVRQVLEIALRFAQKSGSFYIGLEHILAGVLVVMYDYHKKLYMPVLNVFGNIKEFIVELIEGHKKVVNVVSKTDEKQNFKIISNAIMAGDQFSGPEINFLERYTMNLAKFLSGILTHDSLVYSRMGYIYKMVSGLESSTFSNLLLVGERGIGKTFLVYDLAKKLADKEVSVSGLFPEIRKINLPEIIATAKFGSEAEKKLLGVLNEALGNKNVIIYLENFHQFIAPPSRGGMNLSQLLIDFLRSNKLKIIAELSNPEFESMSNFYESIFNLFNIIEVEETNNIETFEILKKHLEIAIKNLYILQAIDIKEYYPALRSIIELSREYILDGYFPHKAVKIFEGVISRKLENVLLELKNLELINKDQDDLETKLQYHVDIGELDKAKEIESLLSKLMVKEETILAQATSKTIVKVQDVYDYIADITGLPIKLLDKAELQTLLELEAKLSEYIVGQKQAVKSIAYAVKRGRLGIVDKNRPWASMLFLGPTGVGKTALAKTLAQVLFGNDIDHFVQLDMSEFMEKHSISKLIGSPPGYIGYEEGGYLTERIKKNPFSVVLFDEIEKASPDVLNILLQILEDGRLTDSHGDTVSFRHTIIILTSNIGADKLFTERIQGFIDQPTGTYTNVNAVKELLLKQLKKKLRPELINRLDEVVVFNPLSSKHAKQILDINIKQLNEILKPKSIQVKLTTSAKNYLVKVGFSTEFGARTLRRVMQRNVETLVTDYMLSKNYQKYKQDQLTLLIDFDKKKKTLIIKS